LTKDIKLLKTTRVEREFFVVVVLGRRILP